MIKKFKWTVLPILVPALLVILAGCGGSEETKTPILTNSDLVQLINQTWAPIGLKLTVRQVDVTPATDKDGQPSTVNIISFKNPVILFSRKCMENIIVSISDKTSEAKELPLKMEEMVMRFNADKKTLNLISCKGVQMDWDISQEEKTGQKIDMSVKMSVGSFQFNNFDVTPMLNTKSPTAMEFLGELMALNSVVDSIAHEANYAVTFPVANQPFLLNLKFDRIEIHQAVNPDLFFSLYTQRKEVSLPDFKKLLDNGAAAFDIRAQGKTLKASATLNGAPVGSGAIEGVDFHYYLMPDSMRRFFTYGIDVNLNAMQLKIPGFDTYEKLGAFEQLGIDMELANLTPDFARSYFEIGKKSAHLNASGMNKEEIARHRSQLGMKLFLELMKSNPKVIFKISPFRHYLCNLKAKGKFNVSGLSIPAGSAVVHVENVADVRRKLQQENLLPQVLVKMILDQMDQLLVVDKKGDGTLVFETREDTPGQFFINGKPVRD